MRIFYAADVTPNSALQSNIWRNNLYMPLVDLGHDVVEFKYNLRDTFQNLTSESFVSKNRPLLSRELLKQVKAAHEEKPVDLFFSYFYDACVLPETIDQIREMGIITVNWYCNGSYQLDLVREISPHYDWCLVPEKFRIQDYINMGARPIYCQEAANPNIYKKYELPQEFDVTFVGQAYGDRPFIVKYLLDQGIDIRVWGLRWREFSRSATEENRQTPMERALHVGRRLLTADGWKAAGNRVRALFGQNSKAESHANTDVILPDHVVGGPLSDTELIKMYSRSKINLGFSTCGQTADTGNRILQIRLRDFEVPMSGGFYMVEYMEELEEFFEIGKEIVCYHNLEDLCEKIKYYLKNDSQREAIRRAGYERCRRDHTWHKRFQDAFREMGLA